MSTSTQKTKRKRRIPLQPIPIDQPNDTQLVLWSLREGILQRLSPHEADLPPHRISIITMNRLRALYKASIQRWYQREAAELKARRVTHISLAKVVELFFRDIYPQLLLNSNVTPPS